MNKTFTGAIMLCLAAALPTPHSAQTSTSPQMPDFHQMGSNYLLYPYTFELPPAQTPAPEGYEPFHMEHYGRHGSRWLIGEAIYDNACKYLELAKRHDKLTPLGEKILTVVDSIRKASKGRDGELSDLGALQHRVIGRRMATNYPEIFNDSTIVEARSTTVIRCILSMQNSLAGIQSAAPGVRFHSDASNADMWYMNHYDRAARAARQHADSTALRDLYYNHPGNGEYLRRLISDPDFARDSIGTKLLFPLFSVLFNAQSHSGQPWLAEQVFSREDAMGRWTYRNASWMTQAGNSPLTHNRMPFTQVNLLRNIIESADTTIHSKAKSANLRYGHDTVVVPLAALLELDDFGKEYDNLEDLVAGGWHDYKITPMGANLQFVFYRPTDAADSDNVLVKVMLNEEERTLPIDRNHGPYYRWNDFKKYYLDKISAFENKVWE